MTKDREAPLSPFGADAFDMDYLESIADLLSAITERVAALGHANISEIPWDERRALLKAATFEVMTQRFPDLDPERMAADVERLMVSVSMDRETTADGSDAVN